MKSGMLLRCVTMVVASLVVVVALIGTDLKTTTVRSSTRRLEDYYYNYYFGSDDGGQVDDDSANDDGNGGDDVVQDDVAGDDAAGDDAVDEDADVEEEDDTQWNFDSGNSQNYEDKTIVTAHQWGAIEWALVVGGFVVWSLLMTCFCDSWWCCKLFSAAVYGNREPHDKDDPTVEDPDYEAL